MAQVPNISLRLIHKQIIRQKFSGCQRFFYGVLRHIIPEYQGIGIILCGDGDCRHPKSGCIDRGILAVIDFKQLVQRNQSVQICGGIHILMNADNGRLLQRDAGIERIDLLACQRLYILCFRHIFIQPFFVYLRILLRRLSDTPNDTGDVRLFLQFPQHLALKPPFISKIKNILKLVALEEVQPLQLIALGQALISAHFGGEKRRIPTPIFIIHHWYRKQHL